eukprot:EG_transcript_794
MAQLRLGVIFVATLAISVVVSATATWGLTYTTSYSELQDMASGFVGLASIAVDDFAQLVRQLISDSGSLVSSILDTEYQRSVAQLNATGQEFLQTTLQLMSQAKNTTTQSQGMVAALVVSFASFMGTVIGDFKVVGTDYAFQLRTESASRMQAVFAGMIQDRVAAIQRQARMYEMGVLNLSRRPDQPFDDASCSVLGLLCAASAELKANVYIGTELGSMQLCDISDPLTGAYAMRKRRGATADLVTMYEWPPYTPGSNFSQWKASCEAGSNLTFMNDTCLHGDEKEYPSCNSSCGYDPRCRVWYTGHYTDTSQRTLMSPVYIDAQTRIPIVSLTFPIYSSSPHALAGVAATDFFFSDVDTYLASLSSGAVAQRVAVVFNSSDLLVVGSNVPCRNASGQNSGVGIALVCDPVLRQLGSWLAAHQGIVYNVSLELNGFLWDVFPGVVDSFSYFVAVGMNKTEVYAVITALSQEANDTLRTMAQQQALHMAQVEEAALVQMDAVSAARIASLQALQVEEQRHMVELQNQTAVAFNDSRRKSAQDLNRLIDSEMRAIDALESFHLTKVKDSVGTTFGAVVGIFVGILLLGAYGTWAVTRQVQAIAQVMEDVADMRVEELKVSQKSPIREVQRIEAALGVLVDRLAEYKSYMPAALFQQENAAVEPDPNPGPAQPAVHKQVAPSAPGARRRLESGSSTDLSVTHTSGNSAPGVNGARLLRRSVVAMAVNIAHFQKDMVQVPTAQLEGTLNRLISTVHRLASKAQGNLDAIVGDQLLVTFNAHFACSDPPAAAAGVALDVVAALNEEPAFPGRVQVGLAAGPMFAGHLGYSSFKAMVALGAPMKVASLLSHLSDFHESVVLLCPSMEERIKYHFQLQPADLVSLPLLGEFATLYAKSISVFSLEGRASVVGSQAEEWLYQISSGDSPGQWAAVFSDIAKAPSLQKARDDLETYLSQCPTDRVAQRLLGRLSHWLPRSGIVLAERPDISQAAPAT